MNVEWSDRNKKMQSLLKKITFQEGIDELLRLRNVLMKEMLSWRDELSLEDYSKMPYMNAEGYHSKTIAYSIWHIMRIEDIVVNTLIQNREEILFRDSYMQRMNASIITTGNELVQGEIAEFSRKLDLDVLYVYAKAVKESTDSWLKSLCYEDLKTCFTDLDKIRIADRKVVSTAASAAWLIDYWCDKDIKGLIKMPLSRHWIMHIEAANRIKNNILQNQ